MNYPVIESRALQRATRRGPLGVRGPRRSGKELPTPDAHHLLVYRVNGDYVEDSAERRLDDEIVTNATHVSVVDMRRDTSVTVEIRLPSSDASEFTLLASFSCAVSNARTVVHDGITRVQDQLRSYLQAHASTFEIALRHEISAVNNMRLDVRAEIEAYTTISPVDVAGMEIRYIGVNVETPADLAAHKASIRSIDNSSEIQVEQEFVDHGFRSLQQDNADELASRKRTSDAAAELSGERRRQDVADGRLRFEQEQARLRSDHQLEEFRKRREAVGDRPGDALHLAVSAGELSELQYAERLGGDQLRREEHARAERDRRWDAEQERLREERADHRKASERAHEYEVRAMRADQERLAWEREEERRRSVAGREDKMRELLWQREDLIRSENNNLALQRSQVELNLQVLRELAERGLLDTLSVDLNKFVSRVIDSTIALPGGENELALGQGADAAVREAAASAVNALENDLIDERGGPVVTAREARVPGPREEAAEGLPIDDSADLEEEDDGD